MVTNKDRIELR